MPIPVPPPPPAKKQSGLGGQLDAMLKANGAAWRNYAPLILKWADVYKMDPLYLAAVLLTENASASLNAKPNAAGAIGPAQIVDSSVNPNLNPNAIWDGPAVMSPQWKANFNNAIKYAAWRMSGQIIARNGLDSAYAGGYNTTAYTGKPPSALLPKGYTPTSGPGTQPTPAETAGTSVAGTQARQGLTDPWVVLTPKGVKTVAAPSPPKNALTDAAGAPYQLSQFKQVARSLDALYLAYSGARAPGKVVAAYIKNPVSDYEMTQRLANPKLNPRIFKSPIWQTHAPEYEAVYQKVYGNDATPPRDVVLKAVVNNLSGDGFLYELRQRPEYENTQEFKANTAQFRSGYQAIYGNPDPTGEAQIAKAARAGWNGDQWTQYLRNQPEYTGSGEFQRNVYSLFGRMGLVQGAPGASSAPQTGLQAPAPAAPTPAPSLTATGSGVNG